MNFTCPRISIFNACSRSPNKEVYLVPLIPVSCPYPQSDPTIQQAKCREKSEMLPILFNNFHKIGRTPDSGVNREPVQVKFIP